MAKKTEQTDDRALEALFAAARAHGPEPGTDFLARVLADAADVQAAHLARPLETPAPRPRGWRRWLAALDLFGTHGLVGSGLATAAVLGFGLGFSGGISGADWMAQAAPMLFDTSADTAVTLLPDSDSFVISLADTEESLE